MLVRLIICFFFTRFLILYQVSMKLNTLLNPMMANPQAGHYWLHPRPIQQYDECPECKSSNMSPLRCKQGFEGKIEYYGCWYQQVCPFLSSFRVCAYAGGLVLEM
jgi:hypothetical protein